jgi:hypothetical protein
MKLSQNLKPEVTARIVLQLAIPVHGGISTKLCQKHLLFPRSRCTLVAQYEIRSLR